MTKVKIAIIFLFIVLTAGVIIYLYNTDTRNVTLTPVGPSFELFKGNDIEGENAINEITKATTLALREGYYCAKSIDKSYSQELVCFTVYKDDVLKDIDFDLSSERLQEIRDSEWASIEQKIKDSYQSIIPSYTICKGNVHAKGEWYTGVIQEKVMLSSDTSDYYRVILHKDSGEWKIMNTPEVAVSRHTAETQSIPAQIVSQANKERQCAIETGLTAPIPDTSSYTPRR